MSFNQSRSDRNETQYRKTGRSAGSNQQRSSSSSYGKGAGGGPAPSPSFNSSSSVPSNRSFKKSQNAQGGHSRVNAPVSHSSDSSSNASGTRNVQNGAHFQPQLHGASDAPVGSGATRPVESCTSQRGIRAVPKVPTSQSSPMTSDSTVPAKASGDSSKGFQFQFGSIGMQIPARTSSAPPNLDEQKRDQARHDSYSSAANLPTPSVPKQQLPRKDMGAADHSNTGESQQVPKVKKDSQVSHSPVSHSPAVSQTQKHSVLSIPMTSMQMPFHQPQVSLQFGGPNPQIQSQTVPASSLPMPMPMPLPIGSGPQVQQHMFVQGLQPHPMQPQGIMHQGQGLNFTNQMGPPQLPPQLGNMGIGMTPQYPQQQGGKYGGPRKTVVKITDPDTHKEVRLDKRADTYTDGGVSAPRSHHNVPQSMPIASFASAHPINYYPNSYNASSMYFPPPSSLPLTSNQMTPNSQAPRFSYSVAQGPQNVSFMSPSSLNPLQVNKTGPQIPGASELSSVEHSGDVHNALSSGSVQVTVKPTTGFSGEKVSDSTLSDISSKVGSPRTSRPTSDASSSHPQREMETVPGKSLQQRPNSESSVSKSAVATTQSAPVAAAAAVSTEIGGSNSLSSGSASPLDDSSQATSNVDGRKKESLSRSNSIKDSQKKQVKKGQTQPQQLVGGKSTSSNMAWRTLDSGISSSSEVSETAEGKTAAIATVGSEGGSPTTRASSSAVGVSTSSTSEARIDSSTSRSTSAEDNVQDYKLEQDTSREARIESSSGNPKQDSNGVISSEKSVISKSPEDVPRAEQESVLRDTSSSKELPGVGTAGEGHREPTHSNAVVHGASDVNLSASGIINPTDVESMHGDNTSNVDALSSRSDTAVQQSAHIPSHELPETVLKNDGGSTEKIGSGSVPATVAGGKDKLATELVRSKSTAAKGKKKRKEILQKADAAGTTSDLYMAYKGPQEKKEMAVPSESTEDIPADGSSKQDSADASHLDDAVSQKSVQSKTEPDDWEDAADISTPKLDPSDSKDHASGRLIHYDGDGNMIKKYSKDFLLKFSEQCTNLPEGFEIASDIADALMSTHVNASHLLDRDSYPSPGRMDRSGGPRMDRRGSVMVDDDRWGRMPGPSSSGRDLRLDIGYGGNAGFRPGQGGNFGVLRNPRAQMPMPYGILSGPMQAMGPQGGMQRNSPDADRWQRATNFQQKGLFPSPQTPLQTMHKAERKYEVGKVTDEEQAKQRQLKAILNKLTPQNFEKLFEQVKAVNIDNAVTLTGVISQIFDKALMEPTFCEMYANFCFYLSGELPDFSEDNEKITFKRLLLNKCQEEFERGEREQEEANTAGKDGEAQQSEEEREEKRVKARRRMLGNIRLIGELYKKKMLTERIMHECIKKLLGQYENPDEEDVEALCKLMSTIGEMIDHSKAKEHMDAYFDRMAKLSNNMKLSSRVRFMLKDSIELRKNKWQQRRKVEGPKKIEEVHRDAAQERQFQTSRLSRGPSMNASGRRGPMDFVPRGMLSSPTNQMGGFRGMPSQGRGYGGQDVRVDDRPPYDARTLSVPLPHRPIGDDSITLGPQGGLARGMSIRGPPLMSNTHLADISGGTGDSRRMPVGLNGFSAIPGPREDLAPRYVPDRRAGSPALNQSTSQDHNRVRTPPDRGLDRPHATSPPLRGQGPGTANAPPAKVLSEERMRDMSMATIKEFYSARDEKEVALCIKDLNSPSFHPSMVSLWVTDSFEMKDMERDLLAKLLVNLTKSRDSTLSPVDLVKGFESVLVGLEDAVNDAPRAAEFLGRMFARVVVENVIPLKEIGKMLKEGGEEPGRLLEIGLAGDVLGSTLEMIKLDEGETVLQEIRTGSNLRLEDFRPPDPDRSKILEKFI